MAAKDEVRNHKKKSARNAPAPSVHDDQADEATDTSAQEAAEHFVRGVVSRGEAAKPIDGELLPGATHEIVEEKPGELPTIKRKRFSMF